MPQPPLFWEAFCRGFCNLAAGICSHPATKGISEVQHCAEIKPGSLLVENMFDGVEVRAATRAG